MRLQKNAKAKEATQKNQKQTVGSPKAKAASIRSASNSTSSRNTPGSKGKSTVPFRPTDTILLIGEGNFSFARALLSHSSLQYLPPNNVTATSYDSEETCYNKYPDARQIVEDLRRRGVEVLFSVDATALERCKPLKRRRWDRVVWNFPHAGKGITDQDRNILSNQILLLSFLRSVASFLVTGPIPSVHAPRKRKRKLEDEESDDDDDEWQVQNEDDMSEVEDLQGETPNSVNHNGCRGTVLITLRNVPPYSDWNLPKLAKSPPSSSSSLDKRNPRYIQLRSFAFHRDDWPGYEHRMTKGERAHGAGTTGKGGEDRTWEFCLRDTE
ncbi:hypothetical protein A7U60_g5835 [Sanghuangporus baumii]|uniref:25S rRNA (uridine-N(3))-methyltransferase BMT5-like domain-containing protein n=1 Tax=Sanghuangporus baumii TaxID=108892 RepID=A0A9Q5HW46_SANBA|nr:hypothetical protein A7U60_g5835 [Sanghuangporus baumii]